MLLLLHLQWQLHVLGLSAAPAPAISMWDAFVLCAFNFTLTAKPPFDAPLDLYRIPPEPLVELNLLACVYFS